jgi:hypothetical protein
MLNTQASLTATFREGTLFLTRKSPNLEIAPGDNRPIVDYLNALVQRGWRIRAARFEGFTLQLDLEKNEPEPNPFYPIFLFHAFSMASFGLPGAHVSFGPEGEKNYYSLSTGQKALAEKFKEAIRADGWQELCSSNVLRTSGYWLLSLWVR